MRFAGRAAGAVLLLALTGCSATAGHSGGLASPPPPVVPSASPAAAGVSPVASGGRAPGSGSALAVLAALPVKGRAPKTGYARSQFGPAWTDDNSAAGGHNGCDTRDDVLAAQLQHVTKLDSCRVASGDETDPYTGTSLHYRRGHSSVDLDHVVALGDAWQKGAQQLGAAQRRALANDPLNLLAVSASANRQKGDGDAATWLPRARAYRCAYVARQIAVKHRYHLWVTSAEAAAMRAVLAACPQQPVPTTGAGRAAPATGPSTPPAQPVRTTTSAAPVHRAAPRVHRTHTPAHTASAASNCTPGYSPCVPIASDVDCAGGSGNGPVYVQGPITVTGDDPYGLDSDHDGIGCEN